MSSDLDFASVLIMTEDLSGGFGVDRIRCHSSELGAESKEILRQYCI